MLKALSHGAILLAACKVRNSTLNKLWWKRVFANFTSIKSRIALQVARKIARCDKTLIHVCLAYLFLHSGQVFSSFKELLRLPRCARNFSKLWKLVHRSPHFDLISQWRSQWGGGGGRATPGEMIGPLWENSDWTSRSGNFILSCFEENPSRAVANPSKCKLFRHFNVVQWQWSSD